MNEDLKYLKKTHKDQLQTYKAKPFQSSLARKLKLKSYATQGEPLAD